MHDRNLNKATLRQKHAMVVAKNLKTLMRGTKSSKLNKHKPAKAIVMVTLRRNNAVAQRPFLTVMGVIPGKIKSRDLFVGKTRRLMGPQSRIAKEYHRLEVTIQRVSFLLYDMEITDVSPSKISGTSFPNIQVMIKIFHVNY